MTLKFYAGGSTRRPLIQIGPGYAARGYHTYSCGWADEVPVTDGEVAVVTWPGNEHSFSSWVVGPPREVLGHLERLITNGYQLQLHCEALHALLGDPMDDYTRHINIAFTGPCTYDSDGKTITDRNGERAKTVLANPAQLAALSGRLVHRHRRSYGEEMEWIAYWNDAEGEISIRLTNNQAASAIAAGCRSRHQKRVTL